MLRTSLLKLILFLVAILIVNLVQFRLHSAPQAITFPRCRAANTRFVIKVLGWRRRASLRRLLYGLMSADYHGFKVDLELWLDGGYAPEVLQVANELEWVHGEKRVMQLEDNYGVAFMTPRSWLQPKKNEYAFFFEDDIVVGRAYFEFCLALLEEYRFSDQASTDLIGISLTMPKWNEISIPVSVWRKRPSTSDLLRFQLASSWGALYFPEAWSEFVRFFEWKYESISHPEHHQSIPEARSERWPRSWKRFLIEWMTITGSYMLYPNFPEHASFSTHYREPGEHTGKSGEQEEYHLDRLGQELDSKMAVPLIKYRQYLDGIRLKPLKEIPLISLYHQKVDSVYRLRQIGLWPQEYNQQFRDKNTIGCILDWALPKAQPDTALHITYRAILDPLHQLAALSNALQLAQVLDRPVQVQPNLWIPSRNETESLCTWIDCSPFEQQFGTYVEEGKSIQLRTTGKIRSSSLDAPGEDSTEVSSETNCVMPALPYDAQDILRLFGTCTGPLRFRQLGGELFWVGPEHVKQAFQPNAQMAEKISELTASLGEFICVGYAPMTEEAWWRADEKSGEISRWSGGETLERVVERAVQQSGISNAYILDDKLSWIDAESIEMKRFLALQVCRRAAFVSCSRIHFLSKYLHRLREIDGRPVKWIDESV